MSKDTRIDLTYYENKYTFETPPDPNWKGKPWTTADLKVLLDELKRCYELIDAMNGNVPYVEHCEECGATDGGEAEGCDYCGIIHYQSKPRGFYHKDSPKR